MASIPISPLERGLGGVLHLFCYFWYYTFVVCPIPISSRHVYVLPSVPSLFSKTNSKPASCPFLLPDTRFPPFIRSHSPRHSPFHTSSRSIAVDKIVKLAVFFSHFKFLRSPFSDATFGRNCSTVKALFSP